MVTVTFSKITSQQGLNVTNTITKEASEKTVTVTTTMEQSTITITSTVTKRASSKTITSMETKTVTASAPSSNTGFYTTIPPKGFRRMDHGDQSRAWVKLPADYARRPFEDLDTLWWSVNYDKTIKMLGEAELKRSPWEDNIKQEDKGNDLDAGELTCKKNMTKRINIEVLREYIEKFSKMGGPWHILPYGCHRLGCRLNTGLWWCSMAHRVLDKCVKKGQSGYQFFANSHPHAAYTRIVMWYANCDDSPIKRPFDYEDQTEPWGG
ncbi:hypothetical protein QBC40DRAFT_349879 [Triangularia verruculosa]|uniref:Uncharacterized protein n=1 Tax=Triangularia verruculosa TaxID=2587418 RepID=A0AAN6XI06_9PEZI|nr:hypothetical protein QBC40DRAFT_349879 [Triangularia verruculosa]